MKRLVTLCMAVGLFIAADAQTMSRTHRRPAPAPVAVHHSTDFAADYRLRAELNRINNKYDRKIDNVRRNHFMRQSVKAAKIRSLQMQRQRELDKAFRKYGRNQRNDYPNRRY